MSNRKKWIVGGVLGVLALSGGLALAQGMGRFHRGWMMKKMVERRVEQLLDQIKATPDQRAAAEGDLKNVETAMQAFHREQKAINEDILVEFAKPSMDASYLKSLADERLDAARNLQSAIQSAIVDFHDKLTPEQKQQVVDLARQHRAQFEHDEAAAPGGAVPAEPTTR